MKLLKILDVKDAMLGKLSVFEAATSVLGVHAASIGAIAILILQRSIHPKHVSLSTKVICLLAFGAFGLRLLPLNFCITAGLASFAAYIIDKKTLQGKVVGEKNLEIAGLQNEILSLKEEHQQLLNRVIGEKNLEIEGLRRTVNLEVALNGSLKTQMLILEEALMDGKKALQKNNDAVFQIGLLRDLVLVKNAELEGELAALRAERLQLLQHSEDDSQGIGFKSAKTPYDFNALEARGNGSDDLKNTIYYLQAENSELKRQLVISSDSKIQVKNEELLRALACKNEELDSLKNQIRVLLNVQALIREELENVRKELATYTGE